MATPDAQLNLPIAITGIGCRFPGGADSPASFWRLLRDGVDAITEIPPGRMDVDALYDPRPAIPGRIMTRWGGFLGDLESFDADFFQISPREAERMDPAQRLLLETAWEALEDAGVDASRLVGSPTGVFVGQWTSDYEGRVFSDPSAVDFYLATGSGRYATAGRLSFALGLQGPSLSIDSACSSSLAAVHLACQSLRSGESSLALAGGVNIILQPQITIAYSQSRMMAPDGRCKFGDARADGYVRSEGVGVVVLKTVERAIVDGDRIYAIVRGSAINNDGSSSGRLSRPSRAGQEEMLRLAYRHAGVDPARVRYVEAHGTGTRAGDPIELGALGAVLAPGRQPADRLLVGSVKTNIGHTEGAAGIAGIIKTALSLHHGAIPASLHFEEPNPAVPWADLPCDIPTALSPWPSGVGPRVAGVSAYGITGTNAHVVLEEAPVHALSKATEGAAPFTGPMHLLALSAHDPRALAALAAAYADQLTGPGAPAMGDVCASAARHRTPLEHRAAFVATDASSLADLLRRFAGGDHTAAVASGHVLRGTTRRLAFVFSGQGSQWVGMARDLMSVSPAFKQAIDRAENALRPYVDWSLVEQLRADPGSAAFRLDDISVIQPVLFAIEVALAALWRSVGVAPHAVVGHSMGEIAAAHAAGALSLDDATRIVVRRSALMRQTSGHGAMALVELDTDEARARIAPYADQLDVAVSNAPRSTVLSGDPTALAKVLATLERDGVFCRAVKVDVASHSPQMDPLVEELVGSLGTIRPASTTTPFYSTVTAGPLDGLALDPSYWGQNLRRPVRFAEAVNALLADGVDAFVEVSPHPLLVPAIAETSAAANVQSTAVASLRRGEPEHATFLAALGALFAAGCTIDWACLYPDGYERVALPSYPWQRERLWTDAARRRTASADSRPGPVKNDDRSEWLYELRWRPTTPTTAAAADTRRAWIVLSRNSERAAPIVAALSRRGSIVATNTPEHLSDALGTVKGDADVGILLLADDAADAAFLPVPIAQTLVGRTGRRAPRLWLVTEGAQAVDGEPAHRIAIEQSALWGTGRVIGDEHPEIWGGLVDLDPNAGADANAVALADALLSADGEDQIAFRRGVRFVLRLVPGELVDAPSPRRPQWRADAAYLITGGLGEVAGYVTAEMVRQGARRFVLLGRTPLPPRTEWSHVSAETSMGQRIAAVRQLEQLGAAVHLLHADVADEAQLAAALAQYAAEGWPPIRGVVHAAGIMDNRLVAEMDSAAFHRVLAPKLTGARNLEQLLPDLELFIAFSSFTGFVPQAGTSNYAAANVAMDALMLDRRARGLHGLSVQWGAWAGTGLLSSEVGARNATELARQGFIGFSPSQVSIFEDLLAHAGATIAVFQIDRTVFEQSRIGLRPLFRELRSESGRATDVALSASADASNARPDSLAERLRAAANGDRRGLVVSAIREAVGRVLRLAPDRIDPRRPFGAMGLDSLMALELRNRLEAVTGRRLSATLAWNYPTIDALADFLAEPQEAAEPQAPVSVAQAILPDNMQLAATLDAVTALSDDEIARTLRVKRRQ